MSLHARIAEEKLKALVGEVLHASKGCRGMRKSININKDLLTYFEHPKPECGKIYWHISSIEALDQPVCRELYGIDKPCVAIYLEVVSCSDESECLIDKLGALVITMDISEWGIKAEASFF